MAFSKTYHVTLEFSYSRSGLQGQPHDIRNLIREVDAVTAFSDDRITDLQRIADEGFAMGALSAPANAATFIRQVPLNTIIATQAVT